MRVELDPRNAQQFGGHAAAGRDDVGDHQIGRQVAQRGHVEHGHPGRTPVDPGAGVHVVVLRRQPLQLDGVDPRRARSVDPFHPGEQRGFIARLDESLAERDRGKRVPGIRPSDHGDAHRPYLATVVEPYAGDHDRPEPDLRRSR